MYMLLVKIQGLFQDSYDQYYFSSTFQALETALSVFQHFFRIPEHCANPDYTSADRPGKDNTTDRSPRQNVWVRLQQTSQVKTPTPGSHFRTLIRSRSSETIGGGGGCQRQPTWIIFQQTSQEVDEAVVWHMVPLKSPQQPHSYCTTK